MPDRILPEQKSAHRAAFEHYLRTGQRLTTEEWLAQQEAKFNPYHDELGRFTWASGASGASGQDAGLSTRPRSDKWQGHAPQRPAPARVNSGAVQRPSHPRPLSHDRDAAAKQQRDIGALAAKYESGRMQDPGTISSSKHDPGGVSYGTFQMSSNRRLVHEFVASPEASAWATRFRGKTPATKPFDDEWRAIAARDPSSFELAQRSFIVRKNYSVGAQKVRHDAAFELDRSSPAVRQAFFSTAVQHGGTGGGGLFVQSVLQVDKVLRRSDPRYEPALINALYDRRVEQRRTYALAARAKAESFRRSGNSRNAEIWSGNAQTAENDARRRYPRERYDALLLLSGQPMSGL